MRSPGLKTRGSIGHCTLSPMEPGVFRPRETPFAGLLGGLKAADYCVTAWVRGRLGA
jgi:hypothetical protein